MERISKGTANGAEPTAEIEEEKKTVTSAQVIDVLEKAMSGLTEENLLVSLAAFVADHANKVDQINKQNTALQAQLHAINSLKGAVKNLSSLL